MIGSIEIFDMLSSRLVYSTGRGIVANDLPIGSPRDFIVIRRRDRDFTPRARICSFSLEELFRWQLEGLTIFESFSELSRAESEFLAFGFCASLGEVE